MYFQNYFANTGCIKKADRFFNSNDLQAVVYSVDSYECFELMIRKNTRCFLETPCKFIIAKLSTRKLGSSSVLMMMTIRAYGSKAMQQ